MSSVKPSFSRRERWLLLLVCVALIAVSIGTTLIVTELVTGQRVQLPLSMKQPISLHEAQLSCEARAHRQLGKRVRVLTVDDPLVGSRRRLGSTKSSFMASCLQRTDWGGC